MSAKDPTGTIKIRNQYMKQLEKRFGVLKKLIKESFMTNNALHLVAPMPANNFIYKYDAEKVEAFIRWLNKSVEELLFEVLDSPLLPIQGIQSVQGLMAEANKFWGNQYILSSYKKGVIEAKAETDKQLGKRANLPFSAGGNQLLNPIKVEKVLNLFVRDFSQLKGITSAMSSQMSRVLSESMAEGVGFEEAARRLNDRVDKIGITRARLLARTEIVNAFQKSKIDEGEEVELQLNEKIYYKWNTAQDERVRSSHRVRHGKIYTKEVAMAMTGEPNCRCTITLHIPSVMGDVKVYDKIPASVAAIKVPKKKKVIKSVPKKKIIIPKKKPVVKPKPVKEVKPKALPQVEKFVPEKVVPSVTSTVDKLKPQYREKYSEYERKYSEFFAALRKDGITSDNGKFRAEVKKLIGSDCYDLFNRATIWQSSTQVLDAVLLKYKAASMEAKTLNTLVKDEMRQYYGEAFKETIDGLVSLIPDEEYLAMRALNQAYMKEYNINNLKLFRGTDGNTGEKFREEIKRLLSNGETEIIIIDNSLAGYTSNRTIAEGFAGISSQKGIAVIRNVENSEIFIHKDLWSNINYECVNEEEFIIFGGEFKVNINDIIMDKVKLIPGPGDNPYDPKFQ